ncbi:MAG: nucleoside deaminase [Woeseiaceae bacterium]
MQATRHDAQFLSRLLDVIESTIVPLTASGVDQGNKIFGGAILRKSDLSLVLAATNNESENPLWHGEVHTLKLFYELPDDARPATSECIFLSTHEPCSLCLSAITWTGFDNFYYLFGYAETDGKFNIPHDLRILDEVFGVKQGEYQRDNAFWQSRGIVDLIDQLQSEAEREALFSQVQRISQAYETLSDTYQASKTGNAIPLA